MAVVRVGERKGRRSTTEADDGTKSHQRVFYTETDADTDHGTIVLEASGIPRKGEEHPDDTEAIVTGRTPHEIEKGHWDIEIDYSPRDPGEPPDSEDGTNKIFRLEPTIAVSFQAMFVPIDAESEIDGSAWYILGGGGGVTLFRTSGLTNAAGEAWDPPVMRRQSMPVITITQNYPAFNNEAVLKFVDSVNLHEVTVAGFILHERTGMMMGITTPGVQYETILGQRVPYFPVTFTIHVNMETWDIQLMEHGTFYIDASDSNKRKAFLTDEGQPRIGLLTEAGDDNTGNDPIFKVLDKANKQEDWKELGLPETMLPGNNSGPGIQGGAKDGEDAGDNKPPEGAFDRNQ